MFDVAIPMSWDFFFFCDKDMSWDMEVTMAICGQITDMK
jgi:hypothetical protein